MSEIQHSTEERQADRPTRRTLLCWLTAAPLIFMAPFLAACEGDEGEDGGEDEDD